jgi:hypothetical protein
VCIVELIVGATRFLGKYLPNRELGFLHVLEAIALKEIRVVFQNSLWKPLFREPLFVESEYKSYDKSLKKFT